MDLIELENSLKRHKIKSPETYDDVINVAVPFFIANKKLSDIFHISLEKNYNLSNIELDVLSSLKLSGNEEFILSPTDLYSTLIFSSGGMSKVLKKLENKSYIIRIDNKNDKRSRLVKLTEEGRKVLDSALKNIVDLEKDFFSPLNKNEQKLLKDMMFKVLENR